MNFSPENNQFHPREARHIQGRELMQSGEFQEASQIFSETLATYGPHVGLLSDMAICSYLQNDIIGWKRGMLRVFNDFQSYGDRLSSSSRLRTAVMVAKFLEEEGRVAEAEAILEQEWSRDNLDQPDRALILANLVRLQALTRSLSGLGFKYNALQALASHLTPDLLIEAEHGLLLCELELFGVSRSWQRAKALLKKIDSLDSDYELILYDYVESVLVRQEALPGEVKSWLPKEGRSPFHRALNNRLESEPWLPSDDAGLTPAEFLRLGFLHSNDSEVEARLNFQLAELDEESRRIWKSRSRCWVSNQVLLLDQETKCISKGIKKICFKSQSTSWRLLYYLSTRQSWLMEELTPKLFSEVYVVSHYNRIRVLAHRLNQKLSEITGIESTLAVTKERVSLDPNLLIRAKI